VASRAEAAPLAPGPEEARRVLESLSLRSYILEIRERADEARGRPVAALPTAAREEFLRTGDRLGFERPYFERRRALVALGLSSWLWREARDVEALERVIEAICGEERWALPAHAEDVDLFACETAFALSEIVACLGGALASGVAQRARAEAERRVLVPFLERREAWAWERMRNNWCAVCSGSIGASAIYLVDDRSRLDAILARLTPTLSAFLESFAEDGACLEGLGYWTYGVGFYVSFAELLYRFSGGKADLMSSPKFRRIAAFQSKAFLTGSIAVAFADSSARERYRPGLAAYLSRRFPEAAVPAPSLAAHLGDDECGRWCLSLRDLLWADGPQAGESVSHNAADGARRGAGAAARPIAWLSDAQWLAWPAAGPGELGFAAKGGHNDEPHNHNDAGSFQLALGGTQFLAELGAGEYTKDYFGDGRYSIFCNSSLGHSLPIVGGRGQEAGAAHRAHNVACRIEGRRVVLAMDIAAAYGCAALLGLRRSFDFDGSALLVLRDEFELGWTGLELVERLVTGLPASSIRIEGARAVLEAEGARLVVSCSLPGLVPRLVLVPHREHDGSRVEVACLDFDLPRARASLSVSFEFRLVSY